jgi:hypothetical protein
MILQFRHEKQMGIELIPTDIIPIVNYAWSGSFDNVETNIKAILERGWFPLNRVLLLHPDIRKTNKILNKSKKLGSVLKGLIQQLPLLIQNPTVLIYQQQTQNLLTRTTTQKNTIFNSMVTQLLIV